MIVQPRSVEGTSHPSLQLGKYQLVATLGQGGMGTVYLALASGFGQFRKLLVVKELRQDLTRQKGFVSMFMDEAKLAARLAHPNVVQTFEASEVGDRYLLAMEYLDGQSLSALLDRLAQLKASASSSGSVAPTHRMSLWMHIQILCEALTGLHYAHELLDYDGSSLQVVHRDVSPQNVFVTYHGQVKVVDFGVAKVANASSQTAPGMFVGKFSYAAPEQILGGPVDARTDVFAAGVMLWQAISGRAFSHQVPTPAACHARSQGLEPRIAEVVPTVDPELAAICDRALAVDPQERFASAKEFRTELQDYMQRAGVRVEASEISQLMYEVFDTERRTLHTQIEQAMIRAGGGDEAPMEDLPILHLADKEPTTVADLSSLVDVSLERDDQKIRQGYAHSKITLVRGPREQTPSQPVPLAVAPPKRRLLTVSALSIMGVFGVSAALWRHSGDPAAVPEVASTAISPAIASKSELAEAVPPARHDDVALAPPSSVITLAPEPSTLSNAAIHRDGQGSRSSTSLSNRSRSRSARSVSGQRESSDSGPSATPASPHYGSVPEPAAAPRALEAGADLSFGRRNNGIRIDRENPYR